MFLKSILKNIWRFYHRLQLRKKYVLMVPNVAFDKNTSFEGYNKIGDKAWISGSTIGRNTYIGGNSNLHNCVIGCFCSIASDVSVIVSTHPSRNLVSTCPVFFSTQKQCNQSFVQDDKYSENLLINGKNCIIGNDVWIGTHVRIKGGITIGDGAIIGMGAIVTKNVEPYAIVGGAPARLIRYRFTREQIDFLLKFQWWNRSDEWLKQNVDLFEDIEKFIARYSKEI